MKILPIIMCGGCGTRVWPESRESLPKQFIPLIGARSTFQMTVENLANDDLFETPIVISNCDYRFLVSEQLKEIGRTARIVLEPVRREFWARRRRRRRARRPDRARHDRRHSGRGSHRSRSRRLHRVPAAMRPMPPPKAISSRSASSRQNLRPAMATSRQARRSSKTARC